MGHGPGLGAARTPPPHGMGGVSLPWLSITLMETTKRTLYLETLSALVVYDCFDINWEASPELVTALITVTCDPTFNNTCKTQ